MKPAAIEYPRVMFGALHGRCGKTVIVSGIARALQRRGVEVQPYKKGPDYIDPGWHSFAAGKPSRSLDSFFMDKAAMNAVLLEAAGAAEVGIIEGAMGLFDGSDLEGSSSSAEVAKQTGTPVILVVDVTRMTRTTAAVVYGCISFDPDTHIAGVIINRVGNPRHEKRIREAIEHYCKIPVIGAIPNDERLALPDRHLGLITALETEGAETFLNGVAEVIEEYVDLDALLKIASSAPPLESEQLTFPHSAKLKAAGGKPVNIAVVRDQVFSFYYKENLMALEAAGAKLTYINSLETSELPADIDGLYIGGGFPEVFADKLQANRRFRESVKACIEDGIACCAECGGLMFLGKTLEVDGVAYDMADVFDFSVEMKTARQGHGYAVVKATAQHPWLHEGQEIKGHEHHHSKIVDASCNLALAYANSRGNGVGNKQDGYTKNRTVASYLHVNAIASPEWAVAFVDAALKYRNQRRGASPQKGVA